MSTGHSSSARVQFVGAMTDCSSRSRHCSSSPGRILCDSRLRLDLPHDLPAAAACFSAH
eukprot:COSAG01_NODE_198_length_22280_cov_21.529775_23_plen_59_part_00